MCVVWEMSKINTKPLGMTRWTGFFIHVATALHLSSLDSRLEVLQFTVWAPRKSLHTTNDQAVNFSNSYELLVIVNRFFYQTSICLRSVIKLILVGLLDNCDSLHCIHDQCRRRPFKVLLGSFAEMPWWHIHSIPKQDFWMVPFTMGLWCFSAHVAASQTGSKLLQAWQFVLSVVPGKCSQCNLSPQHINAEC